MPMDPNSQKGAKKFKTKATQSCRTWSILSILVRKHTISCPLIWNGKNHGLTLSIT